MGGLEDREVVVLLLGLIVAGFAVANLDKLRRLPRWPLPMLAACLLLLGWVSSILETWFSPHVLNTLEHCAYVAHSGLMLAWVYLSSRRPRQVPLGHSAR
jgi:hypothetical protein